MPITIPSEPTPAKSKSPSTLCLYGKSKVGKSTLAASLPDSIIINTQPKGYDAITAMRIDVANYGEFIQACHELIKSPRKFQFVIVDHMSTVDDWCDTQGTLEYKLSPQGKDFRGDSVHELAHGYGYRYSRKAFRRAYETAMQTAPFVIFMAHVRDKMITDGGKEVTTKDIDLTGKCATMLCADVAAVGHLTRRRKHPADAVEDLWVNFTAQEEAGGSWFDHLASKEFVLCPGATRKPLWERIFLHLSQPA